MMRPIHVIESVASHGRVVIWKPFDVNTQIGAEIVIDVCCATVAEVRKRGENFWGEFEFYLSDLAVGMVLDIVLVTLLAPVAVIGKYPKAVQSTGLPPSQPHFGLSFTAFQYADHFGSTTLTCNDLCCDGHSRYRMLLPPFWCLRQSLRHSLAVPQSCQVHRSAFSWLDINRMYLLYLGKWQVLCMLTY